MFTSVKSGSRKEKLAVNAVITLNQTVALAKFCHGGRVCVCGGGGGGG